MFFQPGKLQTPILNFEYRFTSNRDRTESTLIDITAAVPSAGIVRLQVAHRKFRKVHFGAYRDRIIHEAYGLLDESIASPIADFSLKIAEQTQQRPQAPMKQIIQNLANGETLVVDVPCPRNGPRDVMIQSAHSLVSLGTERMLVEFGKANLLTKARKQPDKVKMVLEKALTDGVGATFDAVRSKLNQPIAMGYCNAGVVLKHGEHNFAPGDRVISNGPHAELVCVPRTLVAKVPDSVSLEEASFTPVAAIALQGIRLVAPQIGECVAVTGLGLIGLLTVQLLRAQGCIVIAIDLDPLKVARAEGYGASGLIAGENTDVVAAAIASTGGVGVDGVIITASTASSEPVSQAARMCRKRGRIVLVGVTGLELRRDEFYEKELTFQVSCSYGPGRYDPAYEERGEDYPLGFVRWTEQRNFEAVLVLMERGALDVSGLISARHSFESAPAVYAGLSDDPAALGILLDYDSGISSEQLLKRDVPINKQDGGALNRVKHSSIVVGVIGAGNYSSRILIPALIKAGVQPKTLVSSGGVSAAHYGGVNGFANASSDPATVFEDESINLVVVATRHDSHARYVMQALEAGKNVFVEKPLALSGYELDGIEALWNGIAESKRPRVMVGFNRRFAPQVQKMKSLLDTVAGPKSFIVTMNAGAIPMDSWVQSREIGGGRIIGEACHLIDLMRFLLAEPITSVQAQGMGKIGSHDTGEDKAAILLGFADGSIGTIQYYANGAKSFPKERVEVFAEGRILQLDNFRKLKGFDWPGFSRMNLFKQDKGQDACISSFIDALKSGAPSPIPMEDLLEVSRTTIKAADLIRNH